MGRSGDIMDGKQYKKHIPIGISDFQELIEKDYYFVDKSLLIKEFLNSGTKVTIVPRPRRFGNTLNLSMLRCFFERVEDSRRHLFNGLKIEQYSDCMERQGKYPVIWLTFKDVKANKWERCYEKICAVIGREFARHFDMLRPSLSEREIQEIQEIMLGTASEILYNNALLKLSNYLKRAYKTRVIIFIDEYDIPVREGFLYDYYDKITSFLDSLFCAGLKDNANLEFSVLMGLIGFSCAGIFGGFNNFVTNSFFNHHYADKFGFLEDEVVALLTYFGLEHHLNEVRQWYAGYQSGEYKLYNPWSIVNFVKNKGVLQVYWSNTSPDALINNLLIKSSAATKEELEIIVQGGKVTKPIQTNIVMTDLERRDDVLWNFLLLCGYLTFENDRLKGYSRVAEFGVPNKEMVLVYKKLFGKWFLSSAGSYYYTMVLEGLIKGDAGQFQGAFEKFTCETLGSFDVSGKEPELFYRTLILGMLASLSHTYEIKVNRKSEGIYPGPAEWGRCDVMIIPKDHSRFGFIIEFKKAEGKETLLIAAKKALKQIEDKQYETELRARGLQKIIKLGISFKSKESFVLIENVNKKD